MASIQVPSNVTSITFATSGVKTPDANFIVTGLTAGEATAMSRRGANGYNRMGACNHVSTAAGGALMLSLPTVVTSITIGGVVYNVTGAVLPFGRGLNATVPAAHATTMLNENFDLIIG